MVPAEALDDARPRLRHDPDRPGHGEYGQADDQDKEDYRDYGAHHRHLRPMEPDKATVTPTARYVPEAVR